MGPYHLIEITDLKKFQLDSEELVIDLESVALCFVSFVLVDILMLEISDDSFVVSFCEQPTIKKLLSKTPKRDTFFHFLLPISLINKL